MTTLIMNHPLIAAPAHRTSPQRALDMVLTSVGLAIACCGYFASDITWMLMLA